MTYRVAAGVLQHLLPVAAGRSPETLRNYTLQADAQLGVTPAPGANSHGCGCDHRQPGFDLHPQSRTGRTEFAGPRRKCRDCWRRSAGVRRADEGLRRHCGAEPSKPWSGWPNRRRRGDRRHWWLSKSAVRPGRCRDHDATHTRLVSYSKANHSTTQAASGLSADKPSSVQAKAVIVEEVERLGWRIWNGKAANAKRSIDRIRKIMHVYKKNAAITRRARRHAGYGTSCMALTTISECRAGGLSTTLNCTVPAFVSELRSPRELATFSSIGS
jgi:hypothetical protein